MSDLQLIDSPTINLSLLYNPFDKATSEQHELVYQPGATLSDYLQGLPSECEWMVFHNGLEIELADANQITVQETDYLGLILIPQGGDTIKMILRVVIIAAATVAGFYLGGIPGMVIGAALASIATTILMAPKKPKSNPAESPSYGIDGAKNSATEGIPYPIVYGQFRVGGNFSDVYTENVGDDQYLYVRSVLSDGRVSAIEDIELNEQPVTNFQNVEVRTSLGSLTEPVNDWFRSSIRQVNKSMKVDTAWITHTTTTPVDKVRFDIGFTAGLVTVSKKKGTYSANSVTFVAEYRPLHPTTKAPTGAWANLPMGTSSTYRPSPAQPSQVQALLGMKTARVSASAPVSTAAAGTPAVVQYKPQSAPTWTTAGEIGVETAELNLAGYSFEGTDGTIAGPTNITPKVSRDFSIPLDDDEVYDFRVIDGDLNEIEAEPNPTSNSVTVTDSRTRQIRKSLESRVLPEGFYEVRIRRTTPTSTDQYIIDEVFLTDVAEIETDRVAMRGTANVSLRIKLTDQLNNIPGITAKVTGGPIQQYDVDGNPTAEVTTANHAWVALDMMLGDERGVGYGTDRIDWPRWLEFAEHCEEKNLTINRVFEETTNFGDAFNEVLRGAQAAPVPYGTKLSVVIDRPREASAVFTQANINKGTFAVSYASITDRANEFEVTYYDKNDRNKQKALRYVDPKVVAFSEIPRPAQIDLRGCDNIEMARTELWRAIYSNRYIIRSLSFEANIDAINVVIGDVCLIHHDQMEWADSGRLKSGSTASVICLDQPVVKTVGLNYSVIVHFDAISAGTRVVSSVVGSKILVSGASISGLGAQRVIVNGNDYEIVSLKDGGSFHTIQLTSAPIGVAAGNVCEFWRTDALEERPVASIATAADGTSIVTLATPLPAAPAQFSNFIYGRVENVIKPYALTGISGSGVDKRKLSFVEYNENVYLPPETVIPEPAASVNDRIVSHVETLLFDYERLAAPGATSINARLHWSPASIRNYGGADIYMALNGSAYRPVGSALNVSEFHIQLAPGDVVEFKAVAYSMRGDRAVFSTAPSVRGTIAPLFATLDAPINLTSETTAFEINGTILLSWSPPVDAEGVTAYELEWKPDAETEWNNVGVIRGLQFNLPAVGLGTFDYRVKSVGGSSFSLWSEDTHVVTAPALTGAVTNLKISNSAGLEFTGRDAQFSWTDNARTQGFFLDYRVRILTIANAVIRTEYVSVPSYTYTYSKNVEDGAGSPRREFKIEVSQRGRQGQISTASTISVSNPAPSAPTVSATSTDRVVMLRFTPPVDPDYQSIKVWKGLVADVPEIAGNLIHDGVDTNVSFAVTPSTSYYIRYAAVDAFGISSIRGEGVVTADASSVVTWASISGSPNAPADNATDDRDRILPNVLSIDEKIRIVIDRESSRSDINGRYPTVRARLIALSLSVTALDTASTNWLTYRNSIANWSNTSVQSTISRSTWDNLSLAFDRQLNIADQEISEQDARRASVDPITGNLIGDGTNVANNLVANGLVNRGSVAAIIEGNSIRRSSGDGDYLCGVSSSSGLHGACFAEVVVQSSGFTMVGFDTSPTALNYADSDFVVHANPDTGVRIYANGVDKGGFAVAVAGKTLRLVCDDVDYRVFVDGIQIGPNVSAAIGQTRYALFNAYNGGNIRYWGLNYGPYTNNNFASIGGLTRPSDNAGTTLTLVPTAGLQATGNTIFALSTQGWKTFTSRETSRNAAKFSFRPKSAPGDDYSIVVIAPNDPVAASGSAGYDAGGYGFYIEGVNVRVIVNGAISAPLVGVSVNDLFECWTDNVNVFWLLNGAPIYAAQPVAVENQLWRVTGQILTGGAKDIQSAPFTDNNFGNAGGITRPENNATFGAVLGGNLVSGIGGAVIVPETLQNSSLIVNADGTASYWNGTSYVNIGAVTINGLGFSGDLNATYGAETDANGVLIGSGGVEVDNNLINALVSPAGHNFTANQNGVLDGQQLPATFQFKLLRGAVDVSSTTTWAVTAHPGINGGTVTIANGVVTIPTGCTIATSSSVSISATRNGVTRYGTVSLTRTDAPPPQNGGSGGGTTGGDNTLTSVNSTTLVAISDEIEFRTGAAGVATFAGLLNIIAAAAANEGSFGARLRWKIKPTGGSYSDVGSVISENYVAEVSNEGGWYSAAFGEISASASQTGLTANTVHFAQLFGARDLSTPAKTVSFGGSVSVTGT